MQTPLNAQTTFVPFTTFPGEKCKICDNLECDCTVSMFRPVVILVDMKGRVFTHTVTLPGSDPRRTLLEIAHKLDGNLPAHLLEEYLLGIAGGDKSKTKLLFTFTKQKCSTEYTGAFERIYVIYSTADSCETEYIKNCIYPQLNGDFTSLSDDSWDWAIIAHLISNDLRIMINTAVRLLGLCGNF